jgi:hypothetical protein
MTLILTKTDPWFSLQVSDRAVSNDTEVLDPHANKATLYLGKDCDISIAYSGAAHVGERPTDEWLAEILWGAPFEQGPHGVDTHEGTPPRLLTFSEVLDLLKRELEAIWPRLRQAGHRYPISLSVTGWLFDGDANRNRVIFLIRKTLGVNEYQVKEHEVMPAGGTRVGFIAYPTCLERNRSGEILQLVGPKVSYGPKGATADRDENVFVEEIRAVHAGGRNYKVGPHCMSILIPDARDQYIRVRFLPAGPTRTIIHFENAPSVEMPVFLTPWVVHRLGFIPVTAFTRPVSFDGGGRKIVFMGPDAGADMPLIQAIVARRPFPPLVPPLLRR